jgi:hypothetical protein
VKRPFLTVLTTPVLSASRRFYQRARGVARTILKPGAPLPATRPYPGHHALVRSVVQGFQSIGADYNFNPRTLAELARIVYAPANEALMQAAGLKRRGIVKYLVAGPVNALFPDECDAILQLPEIDLLIVPSAWTTTLYEGLPDLVKKSLVCPCGVDAEYWKPSAIPRAGAVVYWKSGDEAFCESVEAVLRRNDFVPERIRSKHGEHSLFEPSDYKKALDRAAVAVFLSSFETQGIALAEAWSMDVPTLVWDPQGDAQWRGRVFVSRSSAPYLSSSTGATWRTLEELPSLLDRAFLSPNDLRPREWVLANMTDAICGRALYEGIRSAAGHGPPLE